MVPNEVVLMRRKDREVTKFEDIKAIIEKCKVCHLAMVDDGRPYVIPMNFGYELDNNTLILYFHSAKSGRKIEILNKNNTVCFVMAVEGKLENITDPCNSGYYFESVLGFGRAEFIEDIPEKCKALTLLMKHQSSRDFTFTEQQANGVCVFRVISTDFTGKRKPDPNEHTG
jgi:uncharacterized protein